MYAKKIHYNLSENVKYIYRELRITRNIIQPVYDNWCLTYYLNDNTNSAMFRIFANSDCLCSN
jgi:hypothetical protein